MSLPLRQFTALLILAGADSVTVTAMARHMRTSPTTARNTLELLAARGLAQACAADSPRTYSITDAGRAFLAAELKPET
jgi:predicted ArsR family transcriptional regulator